MELRAQRELDKGTDWEIPSKCVTDLHEWREKFSEIQEPVVSEDGERIAAIVKTEDDSFSVCVNGELWANTFEKMWSLRFGPDGRLTCIAMNEDEWTVVQEDKPWEQSFDYVWNLRFSRDGRGVAANIRTSDGYSLVLNGEPWKNAFVQMRSYEISPDGMKTAGSVQVEPLSEGDIWKFGEGIWSIAVDGDLWDAKFRNVWDCVFSDDGTGVAAEIRLQSGLQTIAVDGTPWEETFRAVWRPVFVPGTHDVIAPCLT
ncbi:MAG: hypothetical protein LDL33_10490, partial [Desulfomonile sp.]|nr:hypothetical protein [Desulfomonile sp.]